MRCKVGTRSTSYQFTCPSPKIMSQKWNTRNSQENAHFEYSVFILLSAEGVQRVPDGSPMMHTTILYSNSTNAPNYFFLLGCIVVMPVFIVFYFLGCHPRVLPNLLNWRRVRECKLLIFTHRNSGGKKKEKNNEEEQSEIVTVAQLTTELFHDTVV